MKFRQLIVASSIYLIALTAQAAFVAGMPPAQIRAEVAIQQAAGTDTRSMIASAAAAVAVTFAVQNAVAVEPAPTLVSRPSPLATPITQTACSVSYS